MSSGPDQINPPKQVCPDKIGHWQYWAEKIML